MKLILIVEDQEDLARTLKKGLKRDGNYRIHHAASAEDALRETEERRYDLLIVDWKLPEMNGPAFIRALRDRDYPAPVLMLTVRDRVEDRVQGLESGADDYLTKPFSFEELQARVRALLRRPVEWAELDVATVGPLEIDVSTRDAQLGDTLLDLRKKEFDLLRLLAERAPQVVPRTVIAERVWGTDVVSDNAIDVTVSGLREEMDEEEGDASPLRIETVRGVGYRLRSGEEEN